MSPETIIDIGQDSLYLTVIISAPLLGTALLVGLIIGVLQAATQIQEMTLSFIPKLLVLVVTLFWSGTWILQTLINYSIELFRSIPGLIG